MATNTAKANAHKRTAPKPTASTGAGTTATTKQATGTAKAKAQAPAAPLFKVGAMQPVRPGTHRAYAQAVATSLTKAKPKGFTLAEFKAALVAGAAASTIAPPRGGWAGHNMPTWMANPAQQWLVPAK